MPQFEATVKAARQVWASPDGQKTISEVILDVGGNEVRAKTYSDAIAREGWSGTVETYEKQGRNGVETFVKQPPKEGSYGNQYSGSRSASSGAAKKEFDNFTMYLSYAKDLAIAMLKDGVLDEVKYGHVLSAVTAGGRTLYDFRPGGAAEEAEAQNEKPDTVYEPNDLDMTELNKLFGDETAPAVGEKAPDPWATN